MTSVLTVAGLWLLFAGTHIGLAAVRERIVARTGTRNFVVIFFLIAALTFAALVTYYAAHRFDGPPGLALGTVEPLRWLLMVMIVLGVMLMAPALIDYPRLPTALFDQPIQGPRGIERITRHPFFSGTALLAGAHLLLATHLIGAVFFAGMLLLSTIGAWHQDRKLRARRGQPYADYCVATSAVPFIAIARGRQRLIWRELPLRAFGLGIVLALAARFWHDQLFAAGGWWIVLAVTGGGAIAGLNASRRARAHRLGGNRLPVPRSSGYLAPLLEVTGIGHALLGLFLFQEPLAAMVQEGFLSTIHYGQFDRAAAFWFLLFGPACFLLGQLVAHALERGDRRALTLIGWNLLAMGIAGVLIMPVSGFWILIALAPWIVSAARVFDLPANGRLQERMG